MVTFSLHTNVNTTRYDREQATSPLALRNYKNVQDNERKRLNHNVSNVNKITDTN